MLVITCETCLELRHAKSTIYQVHSNYCPPLLSKSSFFQRRSFLALFCFSLKVQPYSYGCTNESTKIPRLGTLELCDLNSRRIIYSGAFSRPPNRTSAVPVPRSLYTMYAVYHVQRVGIAAGRVVSSDGARLARRSRAGRLWYTYKVAST